MNLRNQSNKIAETFTPLPSISYLRSGVKFNPASDHWHCIDGVFTLNVDFARIPKLVCHLNSSLKRVLLSYAENSSSRHAQNLYEGFLHFASWVDEHYTACPEIEVQHLASYISSLGANKRWMAARAKLILERWGDQQLPGVAEECISYLQDIRLGGNKKGELVRTRDPVRGPLTEEEYIALYRALSDAYSAGIIPLWVLVLGRLHFVAGGRIVQYASLKVSDFTQTVDELGIKKYNLNLPKAKTGDIHTRADFIPFDLSPQTGEPVTKYISSLRQIGHGPAAAMFPESIALGRCPSKVQTPPFIGHCQSQALSRSFSTFMAAIAPRSARLNSERLPITSRRFRYTFGTRMAEEGYSKKVIAERLGHTDLQQVDVYFEVSPKVVDNIDKAMGRYLAPVAGAFRGRIIADESESLLAGAAAARIVDFRVSAQGIGNCGQKGGCGFLKPVACYTCAKFEPWLDAPHELLLQKMLSERESLSSDPRIAAVADEAILAIREVISECARHRVSPRGALK